MNMFNICWNIEMNEWNTKLSLRLCAECEMPFFLSCLQFHLSAVQFEFTIPRKEPGNLGGQIPVKTYEWCLLNSDVVV